MMGHCNIKKFNILGSQISQRCDCLCVFYFLYGNWYYPVLCLRASVVMVLHLVKIYTVTVDCITLSSTTTAKLHSSTLICELHLEGVGMSKIL